MLKIWGLLLLALLTSSNAAFAERYVTIQFRDRVVLAELTSVQGDRRGKWVLSYDDGAGKLFLTDAVYDTLKRTNESFQERRTVGYQRTGVGIVSATTAGVGINMGFLNAGGTPAIADDAPAVGVSIVFPDIERGRGNTPVRGADSNFELQDSVRVVSPIKFLEAPQLKLTPNPADQRHIMDRGFHIGPVVILPRQVVDANVPGGFRSTEEPWTVSDGPNERVHYITWEDHQRAEKARALLAEGKPVPPELAAPVVVRSADRGLIRTATDAEWERARVSNDRAMALDVDRVEGFPETGRFDLKTLPKAALATPSSLLDYLGPRADIKPSFFENCRLKAQVILGFVQKLRFRRPAGD